VLKSICLAKSIREFNFTLVCFVYFFFYKKGLVVRVFVADMLEGLKYANFEAFLYLSEYQHVMRLLFRGLNKWAAKP
jgi:hypothetical protein